MAEPIGALHAHLSAGHAQFREDLGKAQAAVRTFSARTSQAMAAVGKSFAGVMGKVTMFHKLTLAAGVAAFGAIIKNAINTADQFGKLSQAAGVTVESFSGLAFAARLSNVETKELATSLQLLSRRAVEAGRGSSQAQLDFRALKIEVKEGNGSLKSADQLLLEVADRFAGMADGVQKTTYATQLFGRSGAALIPLLNQGRQGIEELTGQAQQLGAVLTKETTDAAARFNDSLTVLREQVRFAGLNIGNLLIPRLSAAAEAASEAARQGSILAGVWSGLRTLALGTALERETDKLLGLYQMRADMLQQGYLETDDIIQTVSRSIDEQWQKVKALTQAEQERIQKAKERAQAQENAEARALEIEAERQRLLQQQTTQRKEEATRQRLLDLGNQSLSQLQKEIDLYGKSGREQAMVWETSRGRYQALDEDTKNQLIQLARYLDLLDDVEEKEEQRRLALLAVGAEKKALEERYLQLLGQTLTQEERHAQQLAELDMLFKKTSMSAEEYWRIYWHLKDAMEETGDAIDQQAHRFDALQMSIDRSAAALAAFATGGAVSFQAMANSIIRDLIRIQLQTELTSLFRGSTAEGGWMREGFGIVRNVLGRAQGGPVRARSAYEVNERGPEMLSLGNRHFLMMAGQSGYVTPTESSLPATPERTPQSIRVVNVLDPTLVNDWAASPAGEKVIVNAIARHATQLRAMLS